MGRRQYLDVVALGRSPYEPLDVEHLDLTTHPFSAVSDRLTAYGHVQCYDLHGYPTNLLSKRYAEQLRRSQSDILDAMGFVVTSAGVRASKSRQRRKQLLITENDCGLAFALFNETLMGFSVWWSQSLRRRLQTFRAYGQSSLLDLIRSDWREAGLLSISSSGLPVWVTAFLFAVSEGWLRESAEDYVDGAQNFKTETRHIVARLLFGCFSACAQACFSSMSRQGVAFSMLQSLLLIPYGAFPSLRSLMPFGESALIKIPSFPSPWSLSSFWQFAGGVLQCPIVTGYLLQSVRPLIASRIHYIIWRRLPKPDRPDALSLEISKQNGVSEWTLPGAGNKADEERARSRLSLAQELLYELKTARDYVLSWVAMFNFSSKEEDDLEHMHFAPSTRRTHSQQRRYNEDPSRAAMIRRRRARRFSSDSLSENLRWGGVSSDAPSPSYPLSVGGSELDALGQPPRVRASIVRQEPDSHNEVTIQLEILETQSMQYTDDYDDDNDDPTNRGSLESIMTGRRQHLSIELTNQHPQLSEPAQNRGTTGLAAEPLLPSESDATAITEPSMQSLQSSRPDTDPDDDRRARLASVQESYINTSPVTRRRRIQHRVTVLSSQPVDSLAYHLAFVLADILLSPFEAVYLRCIARNFLSSPGGLAMTPLAANMMDRSTNILSPTEWFGGGSLSNRLGYAAKLLTIWGFETVVGIGVWSGSLWLTTFLGKRRFGWGRL